LGLTSWRRRSQSCSEDASNEDLVEAGRNSGVPPVRHTPQTSHDWAPYLRLAANLPDESLPPLSAVKTGVYFGYAQVIPPSDEAWSQDDKRVLPMVMSLGWNPFYKNERLSAVRSPVSRRVPSVDDYQGNTHHASIQLGLLRVRDEGRRAGLHPSRA
jgi:hypothetical protein